MKDGTPEDHDHEKFKYAHHVDSLERLVEARSTANGG